MIALDGSVLVAHLSSNDAHHVVASRFLLTAASEPLIAHSLTLAEVLVGGAKTGRATEMLADLRAVGVQEARGGDDEEPLRLAVLRARTGLRLPDCCVLDTARTNGAELATFDAALARAARQLGVHVVP